MDIPVLKYIDVLIGLAVVMILASTVVTALCQLGAQSTYARARALRAGLQELIGHLDQSLTADQSRYIAERVMRHPLLGRRNGIVGWVTGGVRNMGRRFLLKGLRALGAKPGWWVSFVRKKLGGLPLPPVNPTSTVLREEFVLILLEWASGKGPLADQDKQFGTKHDAELKKIRTALQTAFVNNGIPDPGRTLSAVRMKALENEKANPGLPATRWKSDAILEVASSEAISKINSWFDEMGARVTGQFAMQARVWTSVMALLVCVAIQLDSLTLLKRLSSDDKLRTALVDQAKDLQKQREESDRKAEESEQKRREAAQKQEAAKTAAEKLKEAEAATTAQQQAAQDRNDAVRAHAELQQVRDALAQMREPKLSLIPAYLAWEKVEQAELAAEGNWPANPQWDLHLVIGTTKYDVPLAKPPAGQLLVRLRDAIQASGAPVDIYSRENGSKLALVARTTDSGKISLLSGTTELSSDLGPLRNWDGLWEKRAGLFVSWILLTMGTSFWYDLIKNLLNLRSMIAKKDDQDRTARQATAAGPSNAPAPGAASKESEAGDLAATGGFG